MNKIKTVGHARMRNCGEEHATMSFPNQNEAGEFISQKGAHPGMCSNTLECLFWRKPINNSNSPESCFVYDRMSTGLFYFMVVFTSCSPVILYARYVQR